MIVYAFYESDTRVLQYTTALAQRGDTVDVIALRRDPLLPAFEMINGVTVHRIQLRTIEETGAVTYAKPILRFLFHAAWLLCKKHREYNYDLIHVHNVPDFLVLAAAYPKWNGVPVVLDVHDLLPELYASKFKVRSKSLVFRCLVLIERYCAAFATHIIIANHLWCERFAARSAPKEKCTVIRNYPDLDIFVATRKVENQADKFILTYPGSLNWHQGVDVAILAFAMIIEDIPEAEFHIYGDGPAKPALIELVYRLRMRDRISFHDFVPSREIAGIMAQTDLAIEPKRATSAFGSEALSTKILEFMALGIPVIASRTTIHSYYYHQSLIKYYDGDDPVQLANCIREMYRSADLRREVVRNASVYVRENNWQAKKTEYLELIDQLTLQRR
jgi:glycosyltransferase involved in cell wall biosynthesis